MNKKLAKIILIVTILIGGSGCMFTKKESRKDKMMKHLHEKYDDIFYDQSPFGGGMGPSNTTQMLVTSQKYPDSRVWASYTVEEDGSITYADNYVEVKYEVQTREGIQKVMEEIVGREDVLVFYSVGYPGSKTPFDDDTTLEEYLASTEAWIIFTSVVRNGYKLNKKEFEAKIQEKFPDAGIKLRAGTVYFAENDEEYSKPSQLTSKVEGNMQRLLFGINEDGSYRTLDWRK